MLQTTQRHLCKRGWLQFKYLRFAITGKPPFDFLYNTSSHCVGNLLGKHDPSSMTYCKKTQLYSTLSHSVVHDLCSDIDIHKIKTEHKMNLSNKDLVDIVQTEIDQRLDTAVKGLSGAEERFLKVIQLEHSFLFSEGYAIPSPESLNSRNWLEAMTLPTMDGRLLYYSNLERMAQKLKSRQNTEEKDSAWLDQDGENYQSIFLSCLSSEQIECAANHRLASAMLHGNVLVVDMGFGESHLSTEMDPLVSQLWNLYMVNSSHTQPFHLVFTNCNFEGPTYRHLFLTCMVKTRFVLATFTEKSHASIFAQQDLIYLSAQAKENMNIFKGHCVYVIGAYYDPLVHKKLSYAKAMEEKIRCYKLPIDKHVKWTHQAHKDLDLDSVAGILLSVKNDGLWTKAFTSVVPACVAQRS